MAGHADVVRSADDQRRHGDLLEPGAAVEGEQSLPPERFEYPHPRPLLEAAVPRVGRADPGAFNAFHCLPVRNTNKLAPR